MGDYAENIVEYADKLKEADARFSDEAVAEISEMKRLIRSLYDRAIAAYKNTDRVALNDAYEIEERVDRITEQMTANHIRRLSDGECTPEVGTQYLSLATNAERVADHYINVAKSIKVFSRS